MQTYIQGDPRFNVRTTNKRQLVNAWVTKEFRNLQRAEEAGVKVPKPIVAKNNVLVMEFIGDEEGDAALPMRHSDIQDPEKLLTKIINNMKLLYREAGLVHGDLSSYNILIQNGEPVIIDISQGMTKDHPISEELLNRDIENIVKDFKKLRVEASFEEIKSKIMDLKS
jgi:RIO kinase 1